MDKICTYKNLDFGFVILCPEHAVNLVRITANSIKLRYPDWRYICVVDSSATPEDMKDLREICPAYKGKETFSSLINAGMKHAPSEWNFIVMAGTTVRDRMNYKFSYFIDSEKDILFPIADGKYTFVDGTINGLLINKKTYKEVGDMVDTGPLEVCKLMWALTAIEKGCKFKAIAGTKLC